MSNEFKQPDVASMDFLTAVALGFYPRYRLVHKFGGTDSVPTNGTRIDVCQLYSLYGENRYTFLTIDQGALIDKVASTAGSGDTGKSIFITGLNVDGLERNQIITLDSNGEGDLTYPLYRHNSSYMVTQNLITGNPPKATGDINIYCSSLAGVVTSGIPTNKDSIKGIIKTDFERSRQALYTMPSNASGVLLRINAGLSSKQSAAAVAAVYAKDRYITEQLQGVVSIGENKDFNPGEFVPRVISSWTDLVMSIDDSSANVGLFGKFDILLQYKNFDHEKLENNLNSSAVAFS